jgi:hypothetical protein
MFLVANNCALTSVQYAQAPADADMFVQLGHGSNVMGIETTATYDPATQVWAVMTA